MRVSIKFLIYFLVSYSLSAQNSIEKKIDLLTNKGREFLCKDEKIVIQAKKIDLKAPFTTKWFKNDVEISGETKDSLMVNAAGSYKVEVKGADGVSSTSNPVNIYNFDYSKIQLSAEGDKEFCTGRSTFLSAKANVEENNVYRWFKDGKILGSQNSILITNAGIYSLELTENQQHCSVSLSNIVVSEKGGGITATINPNVNIVIYESDSIMLTAFQKNGYIYQWYKDGGQISGATKPTLYVKKGGSYVIEVKLADCTLFSSAVNISVEKPLANEADNQSFGVKLFPNPASDELILDFPSDVIFKELKFISDTGQEIFKTNYLPTNKRIDLKQFPRASYHVIITTSKSKIGKKLILE